MDYSFSKVKYHKYGTKKYSTVLYHPNDGGNTLVGLCHFVRLLLLPTCVNRFASENTYTPGTLGSVFHEAQERYCLWEKSGIVGSLRPQEGQPSSGQVLKSSVAGKLLFVLAEYLSLLVALNLECA